MAEDSVVFAEGVGHVEFGLEECDGQLGYLEYELGVGLEGGLVGRQTVYAHVDVLCRYGSTLSLLLVSRVTDTYWPATRQKR